MVVRMSKAVTVLHLQQSAHVPRQQLQQDHQQPKQSRVQRAGGGARVAVAGEGARHELSSHRVQHPTCAWITLNLCFGCCELGFHS
jgi:hypothetical protein